jgi:hypothetical protein
MATRPTGEFSAASMADIAFLLLIFFLVATTMDTDTVMHRVMSPPSNEPPPEINERNVWVVLVNSKDQLMVEGEQLPIHMLKEKTKEFILNPQNLIFDWSYIVLAPIKKNIIFSFFSTYLTNNPLIKFSALTRNRTRFSSSKC